MADNTGPYLLYEELIAELFFSDSSLVSNDTLTLSNLTVDSGGDIYEFTANVLSPIKGDVILQAGNPAEIIEILDTPDRIRINKTGAENLISVGEVTLLRSAKLPKRRAETFIAQAMDQIDSFTGQFFNAVSGTFRFEGRNTDILHLQIPIISVDKLTISSTDQVLKQGEDFDFVVFNGRQKPNDDRKNPRIKLNFGSSQSSVFVRNIHTRIFARKTFTEIVGTFGYLEPDGSTPSLIKRAVILLVQDKINKQNNITSDKASAGPLKRLKVDLHEEEFFELSESENSRSVKTGINEVDNILTLFKAPLIVGGSFIRGPSDRFNPNVRNIAGGPSHV